MVKVTELTFDEWMAINHPHKPKTLQMQNKFEQFMREEKRRYEQFANGEPISDQGPELTAAYQEQKA